MTASLNRRHALAGVAAVGIGVPVLAACSGSDTTTAPDPATGSSPSTAPAEPTESATATPEAGPLATTADILVGGGTIFPDAKVVVTQPTKGE